MLSNCCQYATAYYDGAYHCISCGAKKVMAKIWKPQDITVYKDWVKAILEEASEELNNWESSFILDMETRLNNGYNLTENQATVLERIYSQYTE